MNLFGLTFGTHRLHLGSSGGELEARWVSLRLIKWTWAFKCYQKESRIPFGLPRLFLFISHAVFSGVATAVRFRRILQSRVL